MQQDFIDIINKNDLSDFIKSITWTGADAVITWPMMRDKNTVSANIDAIASQWVFAYMKRKIQPFIDTYKDTEFIRQTVVGNLPDIHHDMANAWTAAGRTIYWLDAKHAPAALTEQLKKVSDFLRAAVIKYIRGQIATRGEFNLNLRFLDSEFPDFDKVVARAKFFTADKLKPVPKLQPRGKEIE